jgi:zinc-binding alcohol dehydrogenase family protein
MKAVGYFNPGSVDRADALVDLDVPVPAPGPRDLLVRVKAVSVNPADTVFRSGSTPPAGQAKILGFDAAGIVEAVGDEVSLFKVGSEVFYAGDMTRQGTNAELHVVDERIVGHKPSKLDWAHAAAMPLTSITAWELLFDRLRVPYGHKQSKGSILILNGAGGVGSILVQMARRLTGLTVIATASRPETISWVRDMGAHHVINHHEPLDAELERIGIPQVEYLAGLTGTDKQLPYLPKIMAPQGHISMIDNSKHFDIVDLKLKAITVSWELMFTRPMFKTDDMIQQHKLLEEVSHLLDSGILRSTLTDTAGPITAANLKAVHASVETGKHIGKTVLVGF